eukprot:scaffold17905_cov106-Cyclotella_meneghiniana.AAC.2
MKKTKGDITLVAGAGIHSQTNLTIEDTVGDIDVDFGSAKRHTMSLGKTQGNIKIDTGVRVTKSFIAIEETYGDIDLSVGGGKMHDIYFGHTIGSTSLNVDLGDKAISTYNTTGKVEITLNKGNDQISIEKAAGKINIESRDGSHVYSLHDITNGKVDIEVGDGSQSSGHVFNLTDIDGSVRVTAGDGDCVISSHEFVGDFTGILGDGNDDITLVNTDADIHVTTGKGNRNIVATTTSGLLTALLGNGDDHFDFYDTGAIQITSGDGIHIATFNRTKGTIDVNVGRGPSQLFNITETVGDIKLVTANGDQHIIIEDTSGGEISVKTGSNYGLGILDIRDTADGGVSFQSKGGPSNNVSIVNTGDGQGDVSVVIGPGPCAVDIVSTAGDINIDLQDSGEDTINLLEIGGSIYVKTWGGNDLITVDKLYGSLFIDMGAGEDEARINYLGGNGTVLGGAGDDLLLLDARGNAGDPANTMDGSHLDWNGGDGEDRVEMYFVASGMIDLNFYNMDINQVIAKCTDGGNSFTPSFSLGRQPEYMRGRLDGYVFVDIEDCCEAHFSWDLMCGNDDSSGIWYYPRDDESTCNAKPFSDFDDGDTNKYPSKNSCCMEKFGDDVVTCCQEGEGECVSTGTPVYIPNLTELTCQPRDSSLVPEWESGSVSNTIEECCEKCKYVMNKACTSISQCLIPTPLRFL